MLTLLNETENSVLSIGAVFVCACVCVYFSKYFEASFCCAVKLLGTIFFFLPNGDFPITTVLSTFVLWHSAVEKSCLLPPFMYLFHYLYICMDLWMFISFYSL